MTTTKGYTPWVQRDILQSSLGHWWRPYCIYISKFKITYEENKSIGRRYKKQDLIGTPYCITVDYQTIIDNTITLRDRDTTNQIRININNFNSFLSKFIFS